MAAHQAPPCLGFSRQEHWSGLPFPCPMHESESEVAQSCPTLSDPVDCSPPGSLVHGIFQARVLEWGAIAFSAQALEHRLNSCGAQAWLLRGTWDLPRLGTERVSWIGRQILQHWATREVPLIVVLVCIPLRCWVSCLYLLSVYILWWKFLQFVPIFFILGGLSSYWVVRVPCWIPVLQRFFSYSLTSQIHFP